MPSKLHDDPPNGMSPPIAPSSSARALAVFDRYAELDVAQRDAALSALAADDPQLHDVLCGWLAADARAGVLERPCLDVLAACETLSEETVRDESRIGDRLGPWRLGAVLGRGGMGTVYRADRVDGAYRHRVAIKCGRGGPDATLQAEAVRNECQALAALRHPGIAPILDGGVDADGRPWFAMPLLDGVAIDTWCRTQALDARACVALMIEVCDAVAHAHACGRVHGDLKPSNVLVERGRPILVDFGLSAPITAAAAPVAASAAYAAPEILAGGAVSASTDLYALGALLYRLLCGRPPHGVESAMAVHRSDAPPPPSAHGPRRRVSWSLRELDDLVLQCLDPVPSRRPASVRAWQADLVAWTAMRALPSRQPGAVARAAAFMRRRRVAVALAAAIAIVAVLGGSAARQASLRITALADDLGDLYVGTLAQRRSVPALAAAESVLQRPGLGAEARVRGLAALAEAHLAGGDHARATALVSAARHAASRSGPARAQVSGIHARVLNAQSRYGEALRTAEEGLAALDSAGGGESLRAGLLAERAQAAWGEGRTEAGDAALLAAWRAAEAAAPSDSAALGHIIRLRGRRQMTLWHLDAAEQDLAAAIGRLERLDPVAADEARGDRVVLELARESPAAARLQASDLLAARRAAWGDADPRTGQAWIGLAQALYADARLDEADRAVREGEAILRASQAGETPLLADALGTAALIAAVRGDLDQGIELAGHALTIMRDAHGRSHPRTLEAMLALGSLLGLQASLESSAAAWPAIDLHESAMRDGSRQGLPVELHRLFLARAMTIVEEPALAEAELRAVIEALERRRGANSDRVLQARSLLARTLLRSGRPAEAAVLLDRLVATAQTRLPALAPGLTLAGALEAQGDLDLATGRSADARRKWRRAHEVATGLGGPRNALARRLAGKLEALDLS